MPKQSRITGALSVTIAQAVVLLLGYATHLWIGRVLGPGPYGIYGVVLSVQTIFGMVLSLGVPMAISRFVAQDEKHAQSILSQALRVQLLIALAVSASLAAFSPLISRALADVSLIPFLLFVAVVVFAQSFYQVFVQFLSGMHRFNRQAALTSLYATIKLAGAISLIYVIGVYGAFAGFAIGGVVAAMIGWGWTRHLGGTIQRRLPLKRFLSFAGTFVIVLVGLQILISLDLFMVKALLKDDVLAGYYNAAVTLSRIPFMLLQALVFVLVPSVSALTKPGASHDRAAAFIRDTLRYLIALIVPGAALAAATSKSLVALFFSHAYIPAAAPLTVLMVGLGSLAFYLLIVSIVAGAGRPRIGLGATAGLLVISGLLGVLLIPRFNLMGAAWQTTITGLVGLAVLAAYTFRTFRIPIPIKSVINILIATAVVVAPTYIWKVQPRMLPLQYLVLGTLYVVALFLLGEVTQADRRRLAGIHPRLERIARVES